MERQVEVRPHLLFRGPRCHWPLQFLARALSQGSSSRGACGAVAFHPQYMAVARTSGCPDRAGTSRVEPHLLLLPHIIVYIQVTDCHTLLFHEEFPALAEPLRKTAPNGATCPRQDKPIAGSIKVQLIRTPRLGNPLALPADAVERGVGREMIIPNRRSRNLHIHSRIRPSRRKSPPSNVLPNKPEPLRW